jgi:hypothetical protein
MTEAFFVSKRIILQHKPGTVETETGFVPITPRQRTGSLTFTAGQGAELSESLHGTETQPAFDLKKNIFQWSVVRSLVKAPLILWAARLTCFVNAYEFHDVQSLVPLFWITNSCFFQNRARFVWYTTYVYLPLMYLWYLLYFVTNIFGLILYPDNFNKKNGYRFGLFQF